MNTNHQRKLIEAALDKYRSWLNEIPDGQFDLTPPNGGWSYAEVYCHILHADFGSLVASEKCAHKTAELTSKGLNIFGMLVLYTGIFPKVKPNATAGVPPSPKKITKEEARNLIIKVRGRLEALMPVLKNAPDNYKVKSRMGMLNAFQWLKFIRIHTEHHLKQLERIKKSLPPLRPEIRGLEL